MTDPAQSGRSDGQRAVVGTDDSAPAMPVIRDHEKYAGSPYVLVDGTSRMIGWQWSAPGKGSPEFVIAGRSAIGTLKVLERFPLTEDGWLGAWRSVARDPVAAQKAAARLAKRAAVEGESGLPRSRPGAERMLIVTTNEVPGHRITQVHGDVFGLTVRTRHLFSGIGTWFRTIAGGEMAGYTKLLMDSRNQARERMSREAHARGANAIVAMRFDCNEIGNFMSEVAAYGTAVTVEPLDAPATTAQP